MLDVLLGRGSLKELGGPALGGDGAEGLLQEPAGLEAVGAGVAPGLHSGLALRRDHHLDDAGHHGPSCLWISFSIREIRRRCFSTAWKARRSFASQRASAARSRSRRAWRRWTRRGSGLGAWGAGRTSRLRGAVMVKRPRSAGP